MKQLLCLLFLPLFSFGALSSYAQLTFPDSPEIGDQISGFRSKETTKRQIIRQLGKPDSVVTWGTAESGRARSNWVYHEIWYQKHGLIFKFDIKKTSRRGKPGSLMSIGFTENSKTIFGGNAWINTLTSQTLIETFGMGEAFWDPFKKCWGFVYPEKGILFYLKGNVNMRQAVSQDIQELLLTEDFEISTIFIGATLDSIQ